MRSTIHRAGAALITAALFGFAACGGDSGGGDPVGADPGSIRVTVTGDGDPLASVTIQLFTNGGGAATSTATTAANGQATFNGLAEGEYDVQVVVLAGFELAAGQTARRDVSVESGEQSTVTFQLEEIVVPPTEGQVRARVVEGAAGVEDVDVMLFASGGVTPLVTLSTASDGRVLFDALDAGSYDVEIDVPVDFEIAPADTNRKAVTVTVGNTTDVQFAIVSTLVATDTVDVSASGASFTPGSVTIDAGSTVRWTKGTNPHTVTPDGHTEWSEATLDSTGETFLHTFTTPGTFPYHCEVHAGMTGTITVQ